MEKEENQNNTSSDQNQDIAKKTEKSEENLGEEKKQETEQELKEEIKQVGRENFSRIILSLHHTKGKTNYEETRQLFLNRVLTEQLDDGTPKYYNSNILSRYFRKDYYGIEYD